MKHEAYSYSISNIKCPYCGKESDQTGNVDALTASRSVTLECGHCGKEFELSVECEFRALGDTHE